MKFIQVILFYLSIYYFTPAAESANKSETETTPKDAKVLIVVSSYGNIQKATPGYDFEELAIAVNILSHNQVSFDIASPAGGKVETSEIENNKPLVKQYLDNASLQTQLNKTKPSKQLKAENYQAVFIVGGKGAMFDLPQDKALQNIIAKVHAQNGTIAAVCHGPAALVNVKDNQGNYLINGKRVNGFTNAEEKVFAQEYLTQYPFLLQDKLIERGARFEYNDLMLSHVAIDQRLITGQNPPSTAKVIESMLVSMGINPKARVASQEELTMDFIHLAWSANSNLNTLYQASKAELNTQLINMYGHYRIMLADNPHDTYKAVKLLQLQTQTHPKIQLSLAQGLLKLGQAEASRQVLHDILAKHPEHGKAKLMLESI